MKKQLVGYVNGFEVYEDEVKEQKCIVKGCENHKHEGVFVGDLCKPCHQFITTGEGVYSQAYRNTHPVKELNDGGEPVKNATYWKRQYNLMASQNDNLKSGLYHANEQIKYLESHPVKELTDEEIDYCWSHSHGNTPWMKQKAFARAILKKASEK